MRGIVPDKILNTREKVGFNASITDLLDIKNPDVMNFLIDDSSIFKIVKKYKIKELLKQRIKYKVCPARDGDPDILIADSTKSKNKLKWQIENSSLEAIISSAIKFHKYAK